jgi:hypothetical protein
LNLHHMQDFSTAYTEPQPANHKHKQHFQLTCSLLPIRIIFSESTENQQKHTRKAPQII